MNATICAQLETRLHRVERQNRLLLALLCATVSLALLGATKGGGNVIAADEVRTHRLSVINDRGNVVNGWCTAACLSNNSDRGLHCHPCAKCCEAPYPICDEI